MEAQKQAAWATRAVSILHRDIHPWLGWLLAVLVVFGAGAVMFRTRDMSGLPLYTLAGERMHRGEPIYRMGEIAFTYPPLFAVPFVLLAQLGPGAQRVVWYLVNCAALLFIWHRVEQRVQSVRVARPGAWAPPDWVFWLLVLVLAGRHIGSVFENQGHDLLPFLCIILVMDALGAARDRTAGLLAGLATALKATPLLFAPLFLWQRRWAAVVVMIVAVIGLSFLPDLFFPAEDGQSWTVSWYETFLAGNKFGGPASSSAWIRWNLLNQSLSGTLYRLFTLIKMPVADRFDVSLIHLDRTTLRIVTLAAQLAVVAWLFWISRRRLTDGLPRDEKGFLIMGQIGALATAMVLLSPMSSKSHFCVLLLPIAFCGADFLYRRRDPVVGAALGLTFLLGTLTVRGVLPRSLGDQVMALGPVTGCALALLVATGRVLLQRSREV